MHHSNLIEQWDITGEGMSVKNCVTHPNAKKKLLLSYSRFWIIYFLLGFLSGLPSAPSLEQKVLSQTFGDGTDGIQKYKTQAESQVGTLSLSPASWFPLETQAVSVNTDWTGTSMSSLRAISKT